MRNFTVIDCEQRTPEWHQARCGRLTASRAADAIDFLKSGGESAKRRDYRLQLVAERLSGRPQESGFVNAEMQRGTDLELDARAAYEVLTADVVRECGFVKSNTLEAGCSLDGYLGDFDTLISLKCPKTATHIRYLQEQRFPVDYEPQMLHELWITGASAYHFLSYDDRLPEHLQTFLFVVQRPSVERAIEAYAEKALKFLGEVAGQVDALSNLRRTA